MSLAPSGRIQVKVVGGRGARGQAGERGADGRPGADGFGSVAYEAIQGQAGQTVFTTEAPFTDGNVDVILNGVELMRPDGIGPEFTTTAPNTITLKKGLAGNDILVVRIFTPYTGDGEPGDGGNTGSGATYSADSYGAKGDGTTDDTTALQNAINAAPEGAIIDFTAGKTYAINPNANPANPPHLYGGLRMKRNQTWRLNGANLKALVSPGAESSVITAYKTDGWSIQGPGRITGERNIHTSSGGEFGHGITVFNCKNFSIGGNLEITACWGDGICTLPSYTNNVADGNFCENFRIDGVHIWDIRRNGISHTASRNSVTTDCLIHDVNGTAPAGGIDFEPDNPSHYNEDNLCYDVTVYNAEVGIYIAVGNRNGIVTGCNLTGNNSAIQVQDNSVDITVSGNRLKSLGGSEGAAFRTLGNNLVRINVNDNDMYDAFQFVVETLSGHDVAVVNNRIYLNRSNTAGFARMLGGRAFDRNLCVMGPAAGTAGVQFLQLSVESYGGNTYSYSGNAQVANAILAGMDKGGDTYLSPLLKRPDGSSGSVGRVASRGSIAPVALGAGGTTSFDVPGDTNAQVLILTVTGDGGGSNGADPSLTGYYYVKSSGKWTVTLKNQANVGQQVSAYYIVV